MSEILELDRHTLYLVIAATGIALSVVFLSLRSVAPLYSGLTRWAISDALIGSGFLLLAIADHNAQASRILADTIILAGTSFLSNGVWAFLMRPKRFEPFAFLPPIAAAPFFAYFTYIEPNIEICALFMSALLAVQFGATAAVLLYRFPFKRKEAAYYSAAVFIVLAFWFLYASSAAFLVAWIYPVSLLFIAVGMVAWTLGMGVMTAMRLAEELEVHEQQAGKIRQAAIVKNIIDTMPQSIILKDKESKFITCNAAFARTLGRRPEEIEGMRDQDLYPPDLAAKYSAEDGEVMAEGKPREIVERYSLDGTDIWIETIKAPVYGPDGNCEGVLVAFRDITQRKTAEERLQNSERQYRELSEQLETRVSERTRDLERAKRESDLFFDVSLEYLCVTDFTGRFLKLSQSWKNNLGWREDELMNRTFLDFIHREDRLNTLDSIRELAGGGRVQDKANRFLRADGSWVWLAWNAIGMPEQGIVLAAAHDITSRVETEERLKDAREVAEAASRAKSQFISTMSHELRTPLNAVLGYAGLLGPLVTGGEGERYTKSIESSGRALLAIINDLLDLTKVESGRIELVPSPFDPRRMMDEIAEIFRFGAEEKGLYLEFKSSASVPKTLLLDAARLRQVLINLIGNSIKFTDRGSVRVSIDAAVPSDAKTEDANAMFVAKLLISVEDSGIGMTESYRARLFEPFSQQDANISRKYGGTGLGLAIAKRLLDLMGGTISCESEENKGTRFLIEIPDVRAAGNALEVVSFIGGERLRKDKEESEAKDGGRVVLAYAENSELRRIEPRLREWGLETAAASDIDAAIGLAKDADIVIVERDLEGARRIRASTGNTRVLLYDETGAADESVEALTSLDDDVALRTRLRSSMELKRTRDALETKNAAFADAKRAMEKKNAELEALVSKLNRLSMTDELTGVANRRAASDRLEKEVSRAKRSGKPISVLMGDLDRFKLVNDKLGHEAGDVVLAESAHRFSAALRDSDTLGRWGGEEFLAVLPETDLEEALRAAERARERIGNTPIAYGTELVRATVSIGAATVAPAAEDDPKLCASALIRAADDALYRAKAKGRNRVEGMRVSTGSPGRG